MSEPLTRRDLLSGAMMTALAAGTPGPVFAQSPSMTSAEPVTLLFSLTVKEGRENEFASLAATLTKVTRAEDDGCLVYVFLQQLSNPREFVLYEQWRDGAALKAHIAHLQKLYGPPRPQGGGVPAAILDLTDQSRALRYRVLA